MSETNITAFEQIEAYKNDGTLMNINGDENTAQNMFEHFDCSAGALISKGTKLMRRANTFLNKLEIDPEMVTISFRNVKPAKGRAYDAIIIREVGADVEDIAFAVIPKFKTKEGKVSRVIEYVDGEQIIYEAANMGDIFDEMLSEDAGDADESEVMSYDIESAVESLESDEIVEDEVEVVEA